MLTRLPAHHQMQGFGFQGFMAYVGNKNKTCKLFIEYQFPLTFLIFAVGGSGTVIRGAMGTTSMT